MMKLNRTVQEAVMKKFVVATILSLTLAAPVIAQSLDTMLPTLTWPDDAVTVSTKDCSATTAACTSAK
jgi:hypothetical protein